MSSGEEGGRTFVVNCKPHKDRWCFHVVWLNQTREQTDLIEFESPYSWTCHSKNAHAVHGGCTALWKEKPRLAFPVTCYSWSRKRQPLALTVLNILCCNSSPIIASKIPFPFMHNMLCPLLPLKKSVGGKALFCCCFGHRNNGVTRFN